MLASVESVSFLLPSVVDSFIALVEGGWGERLAERAPRFIPNVRGVVSQYSIGNVMTHQAWIQLIVKAKFHDKTN